MTTPTPPAGAEPSPEEAAARKAMKQRAEERAYPLIKPESDRVRSLTSTELIQAFYSHEFAAVAPLRAELERERADKERILKSAQNAHELKSEVEAELERVNGERDQESQWRFTLQGWGGTPEIVHEFIKGQQMRIYAAQDVEKDLTAARARIGELERREALWWADVRRLQEQLALANAKYEYQRRMAVQCFDESHPDDLQARIHAVIKEHERLWLNGGYIYLSSYLAKAIFEMLNQPLK